MACEKEINESSTGVPTGKDTFLMVKEDGTDFIKVTFDEIQNSLKTDINPLLELIQQLKLQLTQPNTNHTLVDNFPTFAQDTFQTVDCEGAEIGSLQEVIKTIVLNNISTKICNVEELATAIQGTLYNNVKQYELIDGQTLTIPANSVHSISYKIISGNVDIKIGNDTLTYQEGEFDSEEASTLIAQEYVFNVPTQGKIKIKTIG